MPCRSRKVVCLLTTPSHCLMQVITWIGIGLASQSLVGVLSAADFASYLAGRSLASRAWSLKNIPEFPKQRKAMVPFLF